MINYKKITAFSLMEMSIVILIIGIIVAGSIGGKKLLALSNLTKARALTYSSPVTGISGLVLWLETTSKNSFSTSSPADQALIAAWNDINPQQVVKYTAIQNTGANQPKYVANNIKGLPALRFDGSSDYMTITDNGSLSLTAWSIFIVAKVTVSQNYGGLVIKGADAFENYETLTDASGAILLPIKFTDTSRPGNSYSNAVTVGIPAIYNYQFTNDATIGQQIYKNGAMASGFPIQTAAVLKTPATSTADNLFIGSDTAMAGRYLNGDIGEIIIFNRALTTIERQDIEQYLSKKWGIKLT